MKSTLNHLLQDFSRRYFSKTSAASRGVSNLSLHGARGGAGRRILSTNGSTFSGTGAADAGRPRRIGIAGTPTNTGQQHSGVEEGPRLLRCNGILERSLRQTGYDVKDYGDVSVERIADDAPWLDGESRQMSLYNAPVLNARTSGAINYRTAQLVEQIVSDGRTVLHLGGDHSIAVGSVIGHARAQKRIRAGKNSNNSNGSIAVLWVDAHADVNLPTTSYSGNMHGMPVAFLLKEVIEHLPQIIDVPGFEWVRSTNSDDGGLGEAPLSAHNIAFIGLRAVDPDEKLLLEKFGIKYFGMKHIDRYGIHQCVQDALQHINPDGKLPLHCSFDIDALDPFDAPSTGTTELGGLTLREGLTLCEMLHESGTLAVFDMVEVNAKIGSAVEKQRTLQSAVQLIRVAFGYPRHCLYEEELRTVEFIARGGQTFSLAG